MKQFAERLTQAILPATLSCPRKLCGQEWEATLLFDLPGWWLQEPLCTDTRCPVCGTAGRLMRRQRP